MICGTGIDIIEISRIEKMLSRHTVLSRVYGAQELEFLCKKGSAQSYAANYCAKEAFAKALGTGVRGFRLSEVQLLRDESGKPFFKLSGDAEKIASREGLICHISVTHSGTLAAAFAVVERADTY
jgi:holo-[acyl-carrier protein] synthase